MKGSNTSPICIYRLFEVFFSPIYSFLIHYHSSLLGKNKINSNLAHHLSRAFQCHLLSERKLGKRTIRGVHKENNKDTKIKQSIYLHLFSPQSINLTWNITSVFRQKLSDTCFKIAYGMASTYAYYIGYNAR